MLSSVAAILPVIIVGDPIGLASLLPDAVKIFERYPGSVTSTASVEVEAEVESEVAEVAGAESVEVAAFPFDVSRRLSVLSEGALTRAGASGTEEDDDDFLAVPVVGSC
jgi:hypothetical protein